ncbi:MAG: hypothetical protein ACRERR_09785 [Moraxellaceae bacterium]
MNQPFRFRRAPQLLAFAVAALSLNQAADAADLRKRLNVRQEASEVVLGTTMYDYYQGDSFTALNDILLAKAMGRIDDSVTTSELLLGDLYTAFGMPDEADTTFSRMAARDMRSQTRNETMFRKGRLQYQQGNYFEAERILNVPLDTQITPLEAERRVMLANVMMSRNEFTEARNLLAPIPLDSQLGAYATYNTGVAHLRADRSPEGVRLLQTVMNLPVSDSETNALKDRAALAIGFNYLQQQSPDQARDALVSVRLEGPFSNSAMLALGFAHYEKKDYKRALSFWLELLTRNPGDPSVQEAMIFAPRAYEALNASQQAFFGYKLAITTLNNQLTDIDQLAEALKKPEWLNTLSPSSDGGVNADPMDVPASVTPADHDTVALLYGLFAQHPFNEGFQQYEQLQRLKTLLNQRSDDLRAMRDTAASLQKRQTSLSTSASRVDAVDKRLSLVAERWPILEKRGRQIARDGKSVTGGTVSIQNMERQFKLGQIDEYLTKQPDTAANKALKNRVRALKGLVLMDAASRAPASQEQIYADIASNETQLRLAQVRMEALQQLLADNQKILASNNEARIRALETRLAASQKQVEKALDEYRTYLRTLAENQLEDTRTRINNDLAEAHLSIARLQDAALLRGDGASGKPQP